MIHRRLPLGNAAGQNRADIGVLQRRTTGRASEAVPDGQPPLEATFSHPGAPTTSPSARWYPPRTATLRNVFVSLATAGTTSTVVTVYINGSSQGTITLASGVHSSYGAFNDVLRADTDYLTVAATTVGAGASDLTVQARLS